MKFSKCLQALCTTVALAVVAVTVPLDYVSAAVPQTLTNIKPQTTIESVQVVGEGAAAELIITSSATLKYTSYKAVAPLRFVVDFSQAVPVDGLGTSFAGRGAIKLATVKRYDTEAGSLTRMEIELVQETEAVITPVAGKPNTLRVSFPGYHPPAEVVADVQQPVAAVASAQAPVSSATTPIVTGVVARGGLVQIQVDGPVASFKTFRLNKPERVIVDLAGAKAVPDLKIVQVNAAGIATARVGSYADKVRIVLDAAQKGLPDATVEKNDAGVAISFNGSVAGQQNAASAQPSPSATVKSSSSSPALSGRAQIEAIDFQAMDTLSRVAVKVSGDFTAETPVKTAGFVSFKIVNAVLPNSLQRSFEAREFRSPVLRVTPIQVGSKKGEDTVIRVAMRSAADFTLRKEADMVYLEFSHAKLPAAEAAGSGAKAAQRTKATTSEAAVVEQQLTQPVSVSGKRVYTGRKVTLEFADAEVRKIFQLLSEVSNKNFVLGDEVKGNIDLKLVGVPWDQALDVILNTKELDKREEGNIILIRGKGKFKSLLDDEVEISKAALKSEPLETKMYDINYADITGVATQFNALKSERGTITSDVRTNKIIVKDVKSALDDMQRLLSILDIPERQVMIEARIVEASTDFVHTLGINWFSSNDPASSGSKAPFVQDHATSFGGLAATAAALGMPGLNSDIVFGTIGKNVQLGMRINAAASAGMVRIISTPKVATLNHKSAKITQGQQIPYTSATSDKVETKFVEAALSLEVTPHINANGTIVMKIDAKNDAPGSTGNPPPINKKQATTEMLLRDGETTVIGGIYVESASDSEQGVPWLMDIPFLGHLFKSTDNKKNRTELLIFITPRILNQTV